MAFRVPERLRVVSGPLASTKDAGNNGGFVIPGLRRNTYIFCIASDGAGWEHVSAAVKELVSGTERLRRSRVPTWEEMCAVKETFWGEEDRVVQYHPPKSEWISNHPDVLHLWRPVDAEVPFPPSWMVGTKGALADSFFADPDNKIGFWHLAGGDEQPTKREGDLSKELPIFVYSQATPLNGACATPEWVLSCLSDAGCGVAFEPGVKLTQLAETFRGLGRLLHQAESNPDLKARNVELFKFLQERRGRRLTKEELKHAQSLYMDIAVMYPCGEEGCPFCIPEPAASG